MAPEWALLIFMEKYDLQRADALAKLQKQDEQIMDAEFESDLN